MTELRMREIVESMPEGLVEGIISQKVRGDEIWFEVRKQSLPTIVGHIHNSWGASLVSFHAVDNRSITGDFKLCVLLALKGEEEMVTIISSVAEDSCEYPSITPEVCSADWYEREIRDFFGLQAIGHPDPRPLVLWDDWPDGTYPLRKDFDASARVPRISSAYRFRKVEGEGVFEIPVGPVHAGVIEPGHFRFSVAGEPILNLEVRLGYVHKGIEKLSERTPYEMGPYLAERMSGDNGFAHSLAYCQAVERIAFVDAPERAQYLRCIFAELERIYNHLGDVGGIALDTAFNVGAQLAYLMREKVIDLNDYLTGSRLLRSVNCLGGVRKDITITSASKVISSLVSLKLDLNDFIDLMTSTQSVLDRVEGTGILPMQAAKDLNIVGPGARASGVDRDVRRDRPYAAYRHLSFLVPLHAQGDVNARMHVKLEELFESMSIIEQALSNLPEGPIRNEVKRVEPGLTGMSLVESPRGELVHWIVSGEGGCPFRHKVRDASFHNWRAMEVAVSGNIVPDFPLINKSFNLSYSGNDL
jgi:Ni,Fe-hydrogenase III large subunit/Ni,Fe-hydrogenase III component G